MIPQFLMATLFWSFMKVVSIRLETGSPFSVSMNSFIGVPPLMCSSKTLLTFSAVILTYVVLFSPSKTSRTGSCWQMPMHPTCLTFTESAQPASATSFFTSSRTGDAPAAMPQVAIPTVTRKGQVFPFTLSLISLISLIVFMLFLL